MGSPQQQAPGPIDRVITMTDALIAEVIKVDPIATTLLGLAKAELVARKAINDGVVLPFAQRRDHSR